MPERENVCPVSRYLPPPRHAATHEISERWGEGSIGTDRTFPSLEVAREWRQNSQTARVETLRIYAEALHKCHRRKGLIGNALGSIPLNCGAWGGVVSPPCS